MNSRRQFLSHAPLGLIVAVAACRGQQQDAAVSAPPPGAPPTFGTAPGAGPAVTPSTFAEGEKLAQVAMTDAEREMAASSWRQSMAPLLERRVGPRKVALDPALAPATRWNPVLTDANAGPARDSFVRSKNDPGPLPNSDDAIAFAPVTQLSRWIEQRKLTSERLTTIYLKRIEQFDPKLRCVITLTKDFALTQARKADAEVVAGKYRSPLHGIPYGVKDMLDTANIATTYGAEPFKNRVPTADSVVVRRLNEAGAVLIAKLSLGILQGGGVLPVNVPINRDFRPGKEAHAVGDGRHILVAAAGEIHQQDLILLHPRRDLRRVRERVRRFQRRDNAFEPA